MKRFLLFSLCALLLLGAFASCQNASAPPDTLPPDTLPPDTLPPDTLPADTIPPDTIPAEINAVSDWGITPGPGNGKANSLILAEKLHTITDNTDVLFPEGLYEIAFPMYLLQKSGVRIIGQNATILRTDVTNTSASQAPMDDPDIPEDIRPYTASSSIFVIDGCQNVCVQGFTFKYDIPSSLSGTVLSKEGNSVVLEITDTTQFTGEEYVTIINTFTKNGVPDKKLEQYASTNFPAQKLSDNTLRVTGLDPVGASRLSKGTLVCLRLATASDYVIKVSGSKDLTFSDLTMHNSLNGGIFVSGRCENVTLSGVTVKPESELSLMSLNADILHISALGGSLLVKDCFFERPGDDCVNVHGMAYVVDSVKDDAATVSAPRFSISSTWAKPGDVIEFFDGKTFACLGSATVTATLDNTYTFDELPDGVTAGTVISNKAMRPAVTIQNTTVQSNRARGFLLQTENAVVENCTFKDTALAAILLAPDLEYWYEMSPSKNVVIRNNTFENCGEYASGIIQIATNHDSPAMTYPSYIHRDIVIQNNTFSSGCRTALFGACVDTLTFIDNDFSGFKGKYASLRYCTNVTLDEQTRENSSLTDVTE